VQVVDLILNRKFNNGNSLFIPNKTVTSKS
jgi:hypothetical protein